MAYHYLDYEQLHAFCAAAFRSYGFDEKTSGEITDILLAADLNGIESHGVQRMVRYDYEIACGMVDMNAKPEVVFETPISAVIDAHNGMGQVVSRMAMQLAIEKAKKNAEPKTLKEYNGIYFDQLQPLFTEYTKMYTRLF
jgi:LDH2 family malate/lactate/ureidoglycolate dehydrogenase